MKHTRICIEKKTQALPFKYFSCEITGYKSNDQKCEICSEAITCRKSETKILQ